MQKLYQATIVLVLCTLLLAGRSSPAPARPPSAELPTQHRTSSDEGQSLDKVAVKPMTERDVGWAVRAVQATPSIQEPAEATKIRVGIKRLEPFVFIDEKNQPAGFSIDLWNAIAADLGIQYEWVLTGTVNELVADVQSGKTDAAIAGISMTPQRELLVDFTYPYFESGLQIMSR